MFALENDHDSTKNFPKGLPYKLQDQKELFDIFSFYLAFRMYLISQDQIHLDKLQNVHPFYFDRLISKLKTFSAFPASRIRLS